MNRQDNNNWDDNIGSRGAMPDIYVNSNKVNQMGIEKSIERLKVGQSPIGQRISSFQNDNVG